jgi:hypothetical protein
VNAPRHRLSVTVFADYFQFYLWDPEADPKAPEDWTDQNVSDRMRIGPSIVVVCPARNTKVPVTVEVFDSDPGIDLDAWDHVAEATLETRSGLVQVHECTGGPVGEFRVQPGAYRLRACFAGLDSLSDNGLDGDDWYHVTLWPDSGRELVVLKRWSAGV